MPLIPTQNDLFKVPTGSVGPSGPIFNVFSGTEHIEDPSDPRLTGVNIPDLPSGQAPTGFVSKFQPPSPTTPTPTGPLANVQNLPEGQDPMTKFNLAILDMLGTAQGSGGNLELFKRQRELQREAISRVEAPPTGEEKLLSPTQQATTRRGRVRALEPEIDAVASEIKARDARLQNFESILGQIRQIGGDLLKNVSPPPEVLDGYKFMLRAGANPTSVPSEIRNKVMGTMTDDDWEAWKAAVAATKAVKETETDKELNEVEGIRARLDASRGDDGKVDPEVYITERQNARMSPGEFDDRFSQLLSPEERVTLRIEKKTGFDFDDI